MQTSAGLLPHAFHVDSSFLVNVTGSNDDIVDVPKPDASVLRCDDPVLMSLIVLDLLLLNSSYALVLQS